MNRKGEGEENGVSQWGGEKGVESLELRGTREAGIVYTSKICMFNNVPCKVDIRYSSVDSNESVAV